MAALTDEEIAREQQAIGDAYSAWLDEHDAEVPYNPPDGDSPTEYPCFSAIVDADATQLGDYRAKVTKAVQDARSD